MAVLPLYANIIYPPPVYFNTFRKKIFETIASVFLTDRSGGGTVSYLNVSRMSIPKATSTAPRKAMAAQAPLRHALKLRM